MVLSPHNVVICCMQAMHEACTACMHAARQGPRRIRTHAQVCLCPTVFLTASCFLEAWKITQDGIELRATGFPRTLMLIFTPAPGMMHESSALSAGLARHDGTADGC